MPSSVASVPGPNENTGFITAIRRDGHATFAPYWAGRRPADVFPAFARLINFLDSPEGLDTQRKVDEILRGLTVDNFRSETLLLGNVRYASRIATFYGHSYHRGTLAMVEERLRVPGPLAALWGCMEEMLSVLDPQLRRALGSLKGVATMPSALRVWKYIYSGLRWCSHPHYDATAFSALVASKNPDDELLRVGLEANGAPIELVVDRVERLRQFQPSPEDLCCVHPGVYANRWKFKPTWHYVRSLPHPLACRYSLIWSLSHPKNYPVQVNRHIATLSRTVSGAYQ